MQASNIPVGIFSMDLSREQLLERMLMNRAKSNYLKIRRGEPAASDWDDISRAGESLAEKPLYIEDTSRLSPSEIVEKATLLRSQKGIKCIFIDSLQKMNTEQPYDLRRQRTKEIGKYLRNLAHHLNIAIVVLCQFDLKRMSFKKKGDKVSLSDFGEDIIIERFSDAIVLLQRDDYYCFGIDYIRTNSADIIIAKNRNGPTGIVALNYFRECIRFEDLYPSEK